MLLQTDYSRAVAQIAFGLLHYYGELTSDKFSDLK